MPWHISNKHKNCSGFAVVKDNNGQVVGCHKTEADAKRQLSALYASEAKKNISSEKIWDGFFDPTNTI